MITERPVYEYVPVSVNDEMTPIRISIQFPMDTVAKLGLLKFDFLGLRYLTILSDTKSKSGAAIRPSLLGASRWTTKKPTN